MSRVYMFSAHTLCTHCIDSEHTRYIPHMHICQRTHAMSLVYMFSVLIHLTVPLTLAHTLIDTQYPQRLLYSGVRPMCLPGKEEENVWMSRGGGDKSVHYVIKHRTHVCGVHYVIDTEYGR